MGTKWAWEAEAWECPAQPASPARGGAEAESTLPPTLGEPRALYPDLQTR